MRTKNIKSNLLIQILLILLILAVGVALYFYLLKPEMDKRDSLRDKYNYQMTYLEDVIDEVDNAKKKAAGIGTLKEMEVKIPPNSELQSVMDNLDEVQAASSTAVTEIRLNNYDRSSTDIAGDNLPKNSALTEAELMAPLNDGIPTSEISKKEKPNNLNLLTLELSVSAYEANDINQFIKKISALPRIYIVDSVKYTNPEVADGVVTAVIQVTTFSVKKQEEATKEKKEAESGSKVESGSKEKDETTEE